MALLPLLVVAACSSGSNPPPDGPGSDLGTFAVETITVDGVAIEVWLAETPAQRAQGFMNASMDQLADLPDGTPRGMLFVFPSPQLVSFFMRDTFVPLDLAYIRADGTIASVHELVPLDETLVPSGEPILYALEVRRGVLATNGLGPGSVAVIP